MRRIRLTPDEAHAMRVAGATEARAYLTLFDVAHRVRDAHASTRLTDAMLKWREARDGLTILLDTCEESAQL